MKIVSYLHCGQPGIGVLDLEREVISPLLGEDDRPLRPQDITAVVAATIGSRSAPRTGENTVSLSEVQLQAPLAHPARNIFCVGKNYAEHAAEFDLSGYDATSDASSVPEFPIVFTKPSSAIVGPEAEIDPHLGLTNELDYEAELAVIIGRPGTRIAEHEAWDHVWGMTLVNDITARDLQMRHKQWFLGKCLDTFLPMGPWAVSLDELSDKDIVLEGRVNGELRQRAPMSDMIFDVPRIIATLSAGMRLLPGDVIATGTPAGVGIGSRPPRFLVPGDEVVVSATGLGTLRNMVASGVSRESA